MAAPIVTLFVRYPTPGAAKTRLIPALGEAGAAALHRRLAERTVATMRAAGLPTEIRFTGAGMTDFARWLGKDIALVNQGDGDLGERMARAAETPPRILIGSDCPDLSADHLHAAADALVESDVVIGPAEDGGYWLIGFRERFDYLFQQMKWGTDAILSETLYRLNAEGVTPKMLVTLSDCDRPDDLAFWPDLTDQHPTRLG